MGKVDRKQMDKAVDAYLKGQNYKIRIQIREEYDRKQAIIQAKKDQVESNKIKRI